MHLPGEKAGILSGDGAAAPTAKAKAWILAATILASSMAFVDSTVVNVALPALQNSFHTTVAGVQWIVESYGIFLAALILVGGSLGDLWGRRRTFTAGVVIFSLASIACGLAANVQYLIIARSIQGVGAALLVPGSLSIISASFDESSRGKAIGTWSGFTAITTAIGPVMGGWLVEHASWRWIFFLNVPLAVAVMCISFWHVPESRRQTTDPVDWPGALLATAGLGGLVYGLIESVNLDWRTPQVFGSVIVGLACLVAFALLEARLKAPMLPLSLFDSRTFAGANLLTLFLYVAVGMFFFLFPLNLIQVQGYSATAAGAAALPFILLMFFLSRWSGGLVARYGGRRPLIVGPLVVAGGFVLLAVPAIAHNYWRDFFPGITLLGFGMAITVAPLTTVVMTSVDQDRVGTASGINNAVARVAGVLAIAVLGILVVQAFRVRLNSGLAHLALPAAIEHDLQANAAKLGGLPVPAGLDPHTDRALKELIGNAVIFGFRLVMLIGAALALASAAVAWIMIPRDVPLSHRA